jgi:triosephosphate isomerase (TIM)
MPKRIVPLIVGNWKMHGLKGSISEVETLIAMMAGAGRALPDAVICPPATLLAAVSAMARGTALLTGGQDCHAEPQGAFTGDISAAMVADAGGRLVIVGHSERRTRLGETSPLVRRKAEQALVAGLTPIVCVGENASARADGHAQSVVLTMLAESLPALSAEHSLVVAYEPIWAIGTGMVPSQGEIERIHRAIRGLLVERLGERGRAVPILYGGSVKPNNAATLLDLKEVNGALVGGASLLASDFYGIISSASI